MSVKQQQSNPSRNNTPLQLGNGLVSLSDLNWGRRPMRQAEVTRDEFMGLETRVTTIEQETEGEKMLTRYTLTQAGQNGTISRR